MKFLLIATHSPLNDFRLPELDSIAALFDFDISYPAGHDESHLDVSRPYLVVELRSEIEARLLGTRLMGIKAIYSYWGDAATYDELHAMLKASELWKPFCSLETTWKMSINTFSRTIPLDEQIAVIETFEYLDLGGPIKLKDPEIELGVFEEFYRVPESETEEKMRRVWMGRKICGTPRAMIERFNLKKRAYIGNTSMEAEVSLMMANQALAAPGKLIYDPFAGTGSLLLVSAAFGALTFGSDIDGRQLRGKTTSINHSAQQYGLEDRLLDCFVFDITQHPFRTGEMFDAIITDPPYGVRAGAKRLGRRDNARPAKPSLLIPGREEEGPAHMLSDYVPPQRPWEMTEVISSLITFSRFLLKPKGRLVFFLPTEKATYDEGDIPKIEGMRMISNSLQDYGSWGRRLITIEKMVSVDESVLDRGIDRSLLLEGTLPAILAGMDIESEAAAGVGGEGHRDFRDKYMKGFKYE